MRLFVKITSVCSADLGVMSNVAAAAFSPASLGVVNGGCRFGLNYPSSETITLENTLRANWPMSSKFSAFGGINPPSYAAPGENMAPGLQLRRLDGRIVPYSLISVQSAIGLNITSPVSAGRGSTANMLMSQVGNPYRSGYFSQATSISYSESNDLQQATAFNTLARSNQGTRVVPLNLDTLIMSSRYSVAEGYELFIVNNGLPVYQADSYLVPNALWPRLEQFVIASSGEAARTTIFEIDVNPNLLSNVVGPADSIWVMYGFGMNRTFNVAPGVLGLDYTQPISIQQASAGVSSSGAESGIVYRSYAIPIMDVNVSAGVSDSGTIALPQTVLECVENTNPIDSCAIAIESSSMQVTATPPALTL